MSKKKVNKETKAYKEKQVRKVRNRCLKLWKECVKLRAGNKCEATGTTEQLNCHHIEDYKMHSYLRYSVNNGICLSPGSHKFSAAAAHKSFLFMLKMQEKFPERFAALKEEAEHIELHKVMPVQDLSYFEMIEQGLLNIKSRLLGVAIDTVNI